MRAGATIQRVLGLLLAMFSATMLLPIVVSLIFADGQWLAFSASFLIILGSGLAIWWPVREQTQELRLREGFLVVAAFWIVLGLFGSVPLLLTGNPQMSPTDAVFESMSGLTTTGATVLTGLAELPSRYCSTASNCSGSGAWASSCSPWRCCPCWASAACSSTAPRRPDRSRTPG